MSPRPYKITLHNNQPMPPDRFMIRILDEYGQIKNDLKMPWVIKEMKYDQLLTKIENRYEFKSRTYRPSVIDRVPEIAIKTHKEILLEIKKLRQLHA